MLLADVDINKPTGNTNSSIVPVKGMILKFHGTNQEENDTEFSEPFVLNNFQTLGISRDIGRFPGKTNTNWRIIKSDWDNGKFLIYYMPEQPKLKKPD